eukprot:14390858-Alexandrium_andersonii.AAC.1
MQPSLRPKACGHAPAAHSPGEAAAAKNTHHYYSDAPQKGATEPHLALEPPHPARQPVNLPPPSPGGG